MLLKRLNVLRGPNYYSNTNHKLLVATLVREEADERIVDRLPQLAQRMESGLSRLTRARFLPDHPASVEAFLGMLTLSLQRAVGFDCTELIFDPCTMDGDIKLVIGYCDEESGKEAFSAALRMYHNLRDGLESGLDNEVENLQGIAAYNQLGPSTASIYEEAKRRNIPMISLDGGCYIQMGYGARQKRFEATITNTTGALAVDKAGNKHHTKQLLTNACLPVPKGTVIRHVENLESALDEVGFPNVIKPLDSNQGKGATIGVETKEAAYAAFALAKKYSDRVIVEQLVKGHDFRILVINYKMVAAAKRTPACVTGNGRNTIAELVNEVNKDPRRGIGHSNVLTRIVLDEQALEMMARCGYTMDTIPPMGRVVFLKETANLSTGGTAEDVTDEVHPDNIALFEKAARIIGLDICGLDVMAGTLSTPIIQNGGAFIEVNAAPGFRMHIEPAIGQPRNVAAAVLDMLYPEGASTRIPIIAVTGTNGKTTTTRLLAQMAQQAGYHTGFTTTDGIYSNNHLMYKGDCSGPGSAKAVLTDPGVEFAVLECARGGILRSGLAFDEADCAIITNIAEDHLGLNGIHTLEQLARVKSVVAKSVRPGGYTVLNADDDLVYAMRNSVQSKVALFSLFPDNVRIQKHCAAGGLAAILDEGYILLRQGDRLMAVESVEHIPLTHNGKAKFNIANILGAVLAAYVSGITLPAIRCTLRRFSNNIHDTPGRLNSFDFGHFKVLVDYAHNTHGLKALGTFINELPAAKKIGVVTAVGDRRNEDIIAIGEEAAKIFDELIIRYDEDLRGRTEFEIGALLRSGIQRVAADKKISFCADEVAAVDYALNEACTDALIVLLVENINAVHTRLESWQSSMNVRGTMKLVG